jgi:hypothetical protein
MVKVTVTVKKEYGSERDSEISIQGPNLTIGGDKYNLEEFEQALALAKQFPAIEKAKTNRKEAD